MEDWNKIDSFDQIQINPNTLIICDIDETLLYFPEPITNSFKDSLESRDIEYWNKIFIKPLHTDIEGFGRLLLRLAMYNGGLCFLTARPGHNENIEFTRDNFASLKLSYEAFKVYYSWLVPKGEFIKQQINLTGYKDIIFIDDMDYNLKNVNFYFGEQIKCYKFVYKKIL